MEYERRPNLDDYCAHQRGSEMVIAHTSMYAYMELYN